MPFSTKSLRQKLQQFPPPTGYLVGFSGGLDSQVLLHALVALQSQLSQPIRAVHTDHGLQPQSADWAAHCRLICDTYQIPLTDCQLNLKPLKGESLEAVAREARYRAFAQELNPGEMLLTAHHQDDQVETLLLQLLRGAGLSGLAAMPELTGFAQGFHARPLLGYSRADLEAYAREQGLEWIEDGSNLDRSFDRNYLRHEVLPLLMNRWPATAKTVSRSARHCAEADHLLDDLLGEKLEPLIQSHDGSLSIQGLQELPRHYVGPLLRVWIKCRNFRLPDTVTLGRIVNEVLPAPPDSNPLVRWSGAEVRRYRDRLYLSSPLAEFDSGLKIPWKGESTLVLPGGLGRLEFSSQTPLSALFLSNSSHYTIRFRTGGECCRPVGRGLQKRVKHLLQEHCVLPWMRDRIPLLDIDGEIAAVIGICACEPLLQTPGSEQLQIDWQCPLVWQQ
ncbi:MAG: tRNA lysidine(34) synthetase TilS [Sedimenticola sp.]|uniref:tRNA(Ile)-lysidine synthase n=1 Tax=Sedimenticola thiotaurini TaxID=1543721 RepID=A0A558CXF2_9GAMM|nr:tRNA lysidine(34) synthetase TilS [Sedimenticola sp.]MCW8949185.1 tRNA lysidine(34) synthetase TilS [Sedimenticola sp.]TVT53459.1 MAG: tRNA lysidine(34) synthetase TilS [Sedimenticola thiotaurini]